MLHDLGFSYFNSCIDFIKGKLPARARNKGVNRSQCILELIHTDICGHITLVAMRGLRYYIAFIVDHSRFGWVELLHEKSKSFDAFKIFKAIVELKTWK